MQGYLLCISCLWLSFIGTHSFVPQRSTAARSSLGLATEQSWGSDHMYAAYWENLLLEEHQEMVIQYRERRRTWSKRRLEESGMTIFGACAEPDSEVFGEKIVRVYRQGETKLPDRFARGDILVMTSIEEEMLPKECLVVDVGKDWLTVGVGSSWPKGLWETRKTPGMFQVRMDRSAPQAPLKAQRIAFSLIRKGRAGDIATYLAAPNIKTHAGAIPSYTKVANLEEMVREGLQAAMSETRFTPNKSQQEAIVWALQRKISLIQGPPGTGKTRVAALLVSTVLKMRRAFIDPQPPRVLAVAHSNGAADVLCSALLQMGVPAIRVGRPASVRADLQHRTATAMVERHPEVVQARSDARDLSLDPHMRSAAKFSLRRKINDVQDSILQTAPVIVTSCIGAHQLLGELVEFPLVVLDEASQATEPSLVCALASAKAKQLVLVGDTRQLPPTVSCMELRDSLGRSPMSRLESAGVGQKTLRVQYRMHPALLKHPSSYFYDGLVRCADQVRASPPPQGFPWPDKQPLALIHIGSGLEVTHDFGGKSNPTEADIVTDIVARMIDSEDVQTNQIAVISPYSKQVQRIRSQLSHKRHGDVRVGTVDSFQGQETDIVVISCVRSNDFGDMGFLRDPRRLCVAITRARRGLIIVGDTKVLQSCRHWASLIDSMEHCKVDLMELLREKEEEEVVVTDEVIDDILESLTGNAADDEFSGLFT